MNKKQLVGTACWCRFGIVQLNRLRAFRYHMGNPQQPINLVWFKRDLRIHDHAPLVAAAAAAGPVLPLYIIEPENLALEMPSIWHDPDGSFYC